MISVNIVVAVTIMGKAVDSSKATVTTGEMMVAAIMGEKRRKGRIG